jgi:hypothetical protein
MRCRPSKDDGWFRSFGENSDSVLLAKIVVSGDVLLVGLAGVANSLAALPLPQPEGPQLIGININFYLPSPVNYYCFKKILIKYYYLS